MRWPDRETVDDRTQGVQLATMEALARHWATDYDWRRVEARLQALPQFLTEIDGVDIHFIHVRSKHEGALPDHHDARLAGLDHRAAEDHRPAHRPDRARRERGGCVRRDHPVAAGTRVLGQADRRPGWDPIRIARAWAVLMERLGYTRYVAQGGDWGNAVTEQLALLTPPGLARHPHEHGGDDPGRHRRARCRPVTTRPTTSSDDERYAWDQLVDFYQHGLAYAQEMGNRPQTLYALADSPVGSAAWMLDHDARSLSLIARVFEGQDEGLTKDDIARQLHALLADEHGGVRRRACTGRASWPSSPPRASRCRPASASSPTRSTRRRVGGRSRPTRT